MTDDNMAVRSDTWELEKRALEGKPLPTHSPIQAKHLELSGMFNQHHHLFPFATKEQALYSPIVIIGIQE